MQLSLFSMDDYSRDGYEESSSPEQLAIDMQAVSNREQAKAEAERLRPPESPVVKFRRVFDGS